MRRFFRLCSQVFIIIMCSGCGSNQNVNQANATLITPTSSSFFSEKMTPSPRATSGSGDSSTPTESVLFSGKQATRGATLPPGSFTPTISLFFNSENSVPARTAEPAGNTALKTPTIAAFFGKGANTLAAPANPANGNTQQAGASPVPSTSAGPVDTTMLNEVPIFTGDLDANWSMDNSWGITRSFDSSLFSYQGKKSIKVVPTEDYGSLFFTVSPSASKQFLRNKTPGIGFYLNAGEASIETGQLAVSVLGSNQNPYWVKDDKSVTFSGKATAFSETKLYFLNVNRTIPSNTWIQVFVGLDKLVYDPMYKYIVGMYIKTDKGFRNTFYIADVALYEGN